MTPYRVERTTLLSLAALLIVWLFFCLPWFMDERIIPHDAKNHFYTMVRFVADALHHRENPFWSPYHYGGFPMLADPQSTLLTPSLWLPALLSPAPAPHLVDAVQLFHLFIIGASIFAFGRARGWVYTAALAAALTAMMGGALIIRLEHVLMTVSMMWLCVALWRLDAALRHGGWWRGVAFGLPLGLMLIDRDHVAYLGAWFLLLFWLAESTPALIRGEIRQNAKQHAAVVLGGVLALLMAALPVLLLLQLAENSNRPEFDLATASWQSLHPVTLVSFFFPEYFGSLRIRGDYWGPASALWGGESLKMHRGMMHLYSGVLPVLLLFWHGLYERRLRARDVRFFLLFSLFILVYSLGRYTPLFAILYDTIPGVDLFRRPADGLFLFGLSISLASGALLHDVLSTPAPKPTKLSKIGLMVSLGTVLYLCALMASGRDKMTYLFNSLGIFIILAVLLAGLLVLARRLPKARPYALAALLLVASFDLIKHMSVINGNARPVDFYQALATPEQEPVFHRLQTLLNDKDPSGAPWRIETLGLGPAVQNIAKVAKFHDLLGYNPIRLQEFSKHLAPEMQNNAANIRRFGDLMTGYDTPVTNALGIKYIVTGAPINTIDPGVPAKRFSLLETMPYSSYTAYIYENSQAEPRAVVVDDNGERIGGAVITAYRNAEIHITVESPRGARLVLRDFDYPGWRASVDGNPVSIERYNQLFRSVIVPAGKSRVIFTFDPLSADNLRAAVRALVAGHR